MLRSGLASDMTSSVCGSMPRAMAGRESVIKLMNSRCTAAKGTGSPIREAEHRQNARRIAGEQKLNGPLDVGIHVPTVFYSLHNGGEVVVRQHHTGGILGHLRSRDAHSHADVRLLQGGASPRRRQAMATRLPRCCHARTMRILCPGHTGVDADLRHKLLHPSSLMPMTAPSTASVPSRKCRSHGQWPPP